MGGGYHSRRQRIAARCAELRAQGLSEAAIARRVAAEEKVNPRAAMRWVHGLTQQQIAERWNALFSDGLRVMTATTISAWEAWPRRGGHQPTAANLARLARVYGCAVEDLLDELAPQEATSVEPLAEAALDSPDGSRRRAPCDTAALLRACAQQSVAVSARAEASSIGPVSLRAAREELWDLSAEYVATSDVPAVLDAAVLLHQRLSGFVGWRMRPAETREVYVLAGASCLLLASVSHDVGESGSAMVQARSAQVFGEVSGSSDLLVWAACAKAMIDLWRGRPGRVLEHTALRHRTTAATPGMLRLAGLEVRALAQLKRHQEARELLNRLHEDGSGDNPGALAEYGPVFTFPANRRIYYEIVSHAELGDLHRAEHAVTRLDAETNASSGAPEWLASWALGRAFLALARLRHGGDVEAAQDALAPVLVLPRSRRIQQLSQLLATIEARLSTTVHARNRAAAGLRDAIAAYQTDTLTASGTGTLA